MSTMNTEMRKWIVLAAMCAAVVPAVGHAEQKISVSIHGVNYSNEDFSFALLDPEDAKNGGAGELIGRFSDGGTVCCYSLPKTWHPGIKVLIKSQRWLKRDADGKLPEINETHTVEVPRYADDKVSDLWVLRQQDGSYTVVSSRYQPDHEKWPGPKRGWPVPSNEYGRERRARQIKDTEDSIENLENEQIALKDNPRAHAQAMWKSLKNTYLIDASKYSGPDDNRFIEYLKESNKEELMYFRNKLHRLEEYTP